MSSRSAETVEELQAEVTRLREANMRLTENLNRWVAEKAHMKAELARLRRELAAREEDPVGYANNAYEAELARLRERNRELEAQYVEDVAEIDRLGEHLDYLTHLLMQDTVDSEYLKTHDEQRHELARLRGLLANIDQTPEYLNLLAKRDRLREKVKTMRAWAEDYKGQRDLALNESDRLREETQRQRELLAWWYRDYHTRSHAQDMVTGRDNNDLCTQTRNALEEPT